MQFLGFMLLILASVVCFPSITKADDLSRGEAMIENYFRKQAKVIGESCLAEYKTKAEWEKAKPELRRQLHEMLGLYPMPPKTDLKTVISGKVETPKYTVEKLSFQSFPNLHVIAHLYLPKPLPKEKVPVVIYVCGHGNIVKKIDGQNVSFGSKNYYQKHPAWLAEHGYACLILDTLQLSEIPGIHHGTHNLGMWWWHTLGYTPAGIECWNGMRALDYLETRPEIDMKRVGVTGRSGGGAYSWWLTAADERITCAIPVAGIADLQAHLNEGYPGRLAKGVITGHCDCMFMVNTYRWDFAMVAALCAPRPVLLGNSDNDNIFPVPGYRRLAEKARKIYDLYGASEKFQLLETTGAHIDTPELRLGAFRWLNKWLKNDPAPVTENKFEPLPVEQLKVLDKTPEGAINATIHEYFIKPAIIDMPRSPAVAKEWWPGEKEKLETALREKVFHGWPTKAPALNLKAAGDRTHQAVRLRAWDFTSEDGIDLRLWLMTAASVEKPSLVVLNVLDETGWAEWCADLGPEFSEALLVDKTLKRDDLKFKQNQRVLERQKWAFAAICPRGIGPTKWAEPGSSVDIQMRRRHALVGQTLDGQRVWDVHRGLEVLRQVGDLKSVPLWLQGKQDLAGVALYASLFENDIARLDLWNPPATHRTGPILLNVQRYLDMPQAMALAIPRQVRIYVKNAEEAKTWDWTMQLQKSLGQESLKIRVVGD
ncbi:MAG: prolyl oligopeptidase family serine peptidase [Planctomycetes bacterium]|nr:prolyl oligopeptidase family serine peptidase [Planctomycetota bacterium]